MTRSVEDIIEQSSVVAVVGASGDPEKPGGRIPVTLQGYGYRVIPVSPRGGELFGEPVRKSLAEVEEKIDIVDVFRPADEAADIARQAVAAGARVVWLQEGITSEDARRVTEEGGLEFVEDRCLAVETGRLKGEQD